MKKMSRLLFLAVLAVIGERTSLGLEAPLQTPFPLGTIGCMLSDVCDPGQQCKDDQLFGSCGHWKSMSRAQDEYEFRLSTSQLEHLEDQIWLLIKRGFTWKDAYTQCTLQNTLLAFAQGQTFNDRLCEEVLSSSASTRDIKGEIGTVLQKLFGYQDGRQLQGGNVGEFDLGSLQPNSNKRDEIVNVHKYFDESKGQLKRDPYLLNSDQKFNNYLTPLGVSKDSADFTSLSDNPPFTGEGDDVDIQTYIDVIQHLSEMKDSSGYGEGGYLSVSPDQPSLVQDESRQTLSDSEGNQANEVYHPTYPGEGEDTELTVGKLAPSNEERKPLDVGDKGIEDGRREENGPDSGGTLVRESSDDEVSEDSKEPLSISPPDEKTLEDLLEGNLQPQSLDDSQLKRLTKFVEAMVQALDNQVPPPEGVTEEESLPVADNSPADQSTADDESFMGASRPSDDEGLQPPGGNFVVDKKTPEDSNAAVKPLGTEIDKEPDKKKDIVKTQYANIDMSESLSQSEAEKVVATLIETLKLPQYAVDLNDVQVTGTKIIFEVKPNPVLNATGVAEEAGKQDVIEQLAEKTSHTLVKSGIGKETQVEVKKQDNKYVVLTFILVGSIAGILLAVIVIYLVKRHARSKEKLAQLASAGDSNEASQDYQDLCRQRMQSKSSEKPEPLHAASRIGSVSESQVRSPSSRSSTSSWSEEPVASNMDISTGHIVLSYMEDHLKNQDRLDQEWEALCAYEADPCSTKVASDASNTRKNRYGDILPYDHSRVVLSTGANVSGSDYVNANFITDHDPRNPAFIATQGPLPHTVADFWQMVWEQGSVVIVMLTKLTENGSAMCHRYWPEEGSDLYHIYEVHLVSEHIWCDDYLVRSFYLKNLQTNETRTVTQFHFLTWPHLGVPSSIKALLDFRRKVNKSYRGRSCPIVVHCSDGCGRTGTYCLIDMVLNRMAKGAKEIDMAATLEHIRDQRLTMVKTKEQFQFSLAAVAEEVHAILKALPQ